MAGELLLINPRRRRHKRRRMSALQRRYFGKRRKRTYARRNPRRRRSVAALSTYTPKRRSRRRYGRIRRGYSRAKSLSIRGLKGFASGDLLPAGVGALGALGVDMAWSRLPIPSMLQTGPLAPVARIGLSVGVGYAAGMIFGKKFGRAAMMGGLISTLYDLAKTEMSAAWPGSVSGYVSGYLSDAYDPYNPSLDYAGGSMPDYEGLGYVSPAPIVG